MNGLLAMIWMNVTVVFALEEFYTSIPEFLLLLSENPWRNLSSLSFSSFAMLSWSENVSLIICTFRFQVFKSIS